MMRVPDSRSCQLMRWRSTSTQAKPRPRAAQDTSASAKRTPARAQPRGRPSKVRTRTRQVRFIPQFGTLRKSLAANQSVTVELLAGRTREALTVHKDAIIRAQGQTFVYVAQNGQAQIRPVQLGDAIGIRFEVLGGLGPGEPVVVRGNERLQPGQPIAVAESG